jgi:hypothetical protein
VYALYRLHFHLLLYVLSPLLFPSLFLTLQIAQWQLVASFVHTSSHNIITESFYLYRRFNFKSILFTRFICLRTNFVSYVSIFIYVCVSVDRLSGLVVRVLGYRSGGPGSIHGTTRKKVVGLERGPLSLVSTTEELLNRKVAALV